MSTMTKKTISVYQKLSLNDSSDSRRNEKLGAMYAAGKTNGYSESTYDFLCDGSVDQLTALTVTRFWADQESAEEWRDFVGLLNEQFNQRLLSTDIRDV